MSGTTIQICIIDLEEAFEGIAAEMIIIPETVKEIGSHAFSNCQGLKLVIFNENGEISIAEDAFENSSNVAFLAAPDSPVYSWLSDRKYRIGEER